MNSFYITTSEEIAEGMGIDYKEMLTLIHRSQNTLKQFGDLRYKRIDWTDSRNVKYTRLLYSFNDAQVMILAMAAKNTQKSLEFKAALLRQFLLNYCDGAKEKLDAAGELYIEGMKKPPQAEAQDG